MPHLLVYRWLRLCTSGAASVEEAAYHACVRLADDLAAATRPEKATLHLDHAGLLGAHYLPEAARPQISALVANGSLWLGPFYARPVQTLATGEALIRNLLYGTARGSAVGCTPQVCLLDDANHISQLPQLLAGFAIAAAVLPLPQAEAAQMPAYLWLAPDGSAVTLLVACVVDSDEPLAALEKAAEEKGLALQPGHLDEILARRQPPVAQLQGELSVPALFPAAKLPLGASYPGHVGATPACIGAWPSLRAAMWEAQHALARWAEPWAAAAWLCGSPVPPHFLRHAWQLVLTNQQCDIWSAARSDMLHRHALAAAEKAQHLANAVWQDGISRVARRAGATPSSPQARDSAVTESPGASGVPLLIANPLGFPRSEVVTAAVTLPAGASHLALAGSNGKPLPYQLHHVEPVAENSPADAGAQLTAQPRRFTVSFWAADIPATGYRTVLAQPAQQRPYFMGESIAAGNTLENKYLRVVVKPNGALRIEDKRTGRTFDNCHVFEDGGDAGTSAAFAPPNYDCLITTYAAHAQVSIVENGILLGTIQVRHELPVPAELHPARTHRDDEHTTCTIVSQITLRQGSDRVEIHTAVKNQAKDHRLRVLLTSGISARTCHVAQPFDVVERATGIVDRGLVSPARGTCAALGFIDISDARHGLAVASRGVFEYEIKPTPAGTVALTLFRALAEAGAASQALETLHYDYCLIPHSGNWQEAWQSAAEFCSPLRVWSGAGPGAASRLPAPADSAAFSLVACRPQPLTLSAVKRSEDGKALIVRVYNPTVHPIEGELTLGVPVQAAFLARLDETELTPLNCPEPQRVPLWCGPRQIATVRLLPQLPVVETPV